MNLEVWIACHVNEGIVLAITFAFVSTLRSRDNSITLYVKPWKCRRRKSFPAQSKTRASTPPVPL
ncbi:hypothetical protein CC86DRAFT_198279 [Ophiobolus disseminans]|uniref:Uncharacterized protein n=1 Tax=Ophiobolus disseminans TaxID=1469910 RepID=A0A6A7A7L5_9PLEO|nr:hypothetical protein CC86DRAFT_198279 [Ophiobolus disseminans]